VSDTLEEEEEDEELASNFFFFFDAAGSFGCVDAFFCVCFFFELAARIFLELARGDDAFFFELPRRAVGVFFLLETEVRDA